MAQRGLFIAAVAIVSLALTAAAAHAEPGPADRLSELAAPYNPVFLPLFFEPGEDYAGRPYKSSTVLQFDGDLLDGDADFLFRLQAKRSQLVFVEVRF